MLVVNANNLSDLDTNLIFDYGPTYPDFSQILLFIQNWGITWDNMNSNDEITPESWYYPTALKVWNKVINYLWVQNKESKIFWTPEGSNYGTNGNIYLNYGTWYGKRTFRLWSYWQLKQGHTIWKKITYNLCLSIESQYTVLSSAYMRLGLLHTDWTITYLPDIDITSYAIPYAQTNSKRRTLIEATTTWLTTQDGDRVIVEVEVNTTNTWSWTVRVYWNTWLLGSLTAAPSSNTVGSPAPIQISVE